MGRVFEGLDVLANALARLESDGFVSNVPAGAKARPKSKVPGCASLWLALFGGCYEACAHLALAVTPSVAARAYRSMLHFNAPVTFSDSEQRSGWRFSVCDHSSAETAV